MAHQHSQQSGHQLFVCHASDTLSGCHLTLTEWFTAVSKSSHSRARQAEHAGLPSIIMLSVSMKIMVTFNVDTKLDIANRARGELIKIVLNERELQYCTSSSVVELEYPPAYILVKMLSVKVPHLDGLQENVIPLTALECTYSIQVGNQTKTIL